MQHRHALHRHLVGQLGAASGCEVIVSVTVVILEVNGFEEFYLFERFLR
jgi:hypothetical protein